MKELLKYLKPYTGKMLLAILCFSIATITNLLLPTWMSNILDQGIYQKDMGYIVSCSLQMLGIACIGLLAMIGGSKFGTEVTAGFSADLRRMVFQKVNTLTFPAFGSFGTGALITRSTHDIGTVSWVASMAANSLITIPVLFIGGVVLSMLKDVVLSLILLAFVPLVLLLVVWIGRRIMPLWRKSDAYIDKQNDFMRERLTGIRVIRAFLKEPREHEKISEATEVMAENIIRGNVSMGLISPLAVFILNAAVLLMVYVGALRMENVTNTLSAGDIFAVMQYIALVTNAVLMCAFAIVMYPHAKVAADRIGQVMEADGTQNTDTVQPVSWQGGIQAEHLTFSYEGAAEPALKDFSMEIRPGEKIAVIGGTGSGKSTLVQLLLGFYAPTAGTLSFDGVPSDQISVREIRDNVSCVLQKTAIYSGTVAENIRMGDPNATKEEVEEAAKLAQIHDFIQTLPEGYEHVLQQAGSNLSGGQKQRICIARSVLKRSKIYIYDDSFSALDFMTEAKVRAGLNGRLQGCTQILITQRVSSAMHADRIYVLHQGVLQDAGDHEALLERCAIYKEIYQSQQGGGAA